MVLSTSEDYRSEGYVEIFARITTLILHKATMNAFHNIKRKITKPKQFDKKALDTLRDDKLLQYIEKCEYLEIGILASALQREKSTEIIMKMIDVGVHQIKKQNQYEGNALNFACEYKASVEVIMRIIDEGGRQLIMEKNEGNCGNTALHHTCEHEAPTEVIMKIIDLGGQELVMERNYNGCSVLHFACKYTAPTEVIMKIIEIGGCQIALGKNMSGCTVLHYACMWQASTEVILEMIDVGGRELVLEKDEFEYTALQYASEYMHYASEYSPETEVIMKLARGHDSTHEQVKQTVTCAVEAMAMAQQCSVVHIAAKYGLKWGIHTKEVAESNIQEVAN